MRLVGSMSVRMTHWVRSSFCWCVIVVTLAALELPICCNEDLAARIGFLMPAFDPVLAVTPTRRWIQLRVESRVLSGCEAERKPREGGRR